MLEFFLNSTVRFTLQMPCALFLISSVRRYVFSHLKCCFSKQKFPFPMFLISFISEILRLAGIGNFFTSKIHHLKPKEYWLNMWWLHLTAFYFKCNVLYLIPFVKSGHRESCRAFLSFPCVSFCNALTEIIDLN